MRLWKEFWPGYKTYILGAMAIIWGIFGLVMGYIDQTVAYQAIFSGLGMWGIRAAID